MNKMILAVTFFSVSMLSSQAKDLSNNTQGNLQTTQQYYAQLLAGPQPRLAELSMLMTMLPKGGDIHHHYSGSIYAETYLDWVEQQGFCIYRESNVANLTNKQEKFRIETKPTTSSEPNNTCIKVDAVRKDNAFYRELLASWSGNDFEHHSHKQLAPDQHFFNTFSYFSPISKFSTKAGLQILKLRAKEENLQYLETLLKSAPVTDHPEFSAQLDALPANASAEVLQQALSKLADFLTHDEGAQKKIANYVAELTDDVAGIDDAEFSLRLQSYVARNSTPSKVFSGLFAAFSASQNSPLIVGVNIVGAENGLVALRDYTLHMQMFRFLKQRFPKVHLSLHAGELALGMVPPEHLRQHIRAALEIAGAERIGHGIDITHEASPDQLLAELKRRQVAIEINLTSNAFILGVEQQIHPITVYLRHQVPIVISSDDTGVSRNNLSNEYLLFTSRYKPSYDTLKKVVYNSIRYSFLNQAEKTNQLRQLDQRFVTFEATVAKMAHSMCQISCRLKN